MAKEEQDLNSVNELNIDNFFAPDAGFIAEQPNDNDESQENESGEADELDTSEGTEDEGLDGEDADDDEEPIFEDDDGNEYDEDDVEYDKESDSFYVDADAEALKKKSDNAEEQRREMQGKYDKLLSSYNNDISSLKEEMAELKTKAKDSEYDDLFSGDDDNVMTEGQVKQIIAKANQKPAPKPAIGTDEEAQQMWANSQTDVGDVTDYFNRNNLNNDPELMGMRTIEGRYEKVRSKILRDELKSARSEAKKLKSQIKKMKKGKIPDKAGAGSRGVERGQSDGNKGDALDKFFGNSSY